MNSIRRMPTFEAESRKSQMTRVEVEVIDVEDMEY